MVKIFLYILLFILIINDIIQAVPLTSDDNEDIMVASSHLHRGADRLHHRINSIPDIMNLPSNNFIPHFRRDSNYPIPREEEEEPETFYVNMKVDSDEDLETKYVNLFIDTKQNINT